MPTQDTSKEEQIESGYNKVAHDIPYDRELEGMTYTKLSIELEKSKAGSARHSVLMREKTKRDMAESSVNAEPNTAPNPSADNSNNEQGWHNKPIGLVGIGVIIFIIGALAVYLIKHNAGIPL